MKLIIRDFKRKYKKLYHITSKKETFTVCYKSRLIVQYNFVLNRKKTKSAYF